MNHAKETGPRFSISARINLINAGFPLRVFKRSTFHVRRWTFNCRVLNWTLECWALSVQRFALKFSTPENVHDLSQTSAGLPLSSALVLEAAILHSRGHHCGVGHCLCGLHFNSCRRLESPGPNI